MKYLIIITSITIVSLFMFCSCTKDKKTTINDYRDDYCGNFKCVEIKYTPLPRTINTYNITISKSPVDSYLVFSNITQPLKFNVSNTLIDGNELIYELMMPATSQKRLIYGNYYEFSKDSILIDDRILSVPIPTYNSYKLYQYQLSRLPN